MPAIRPAGSTLALAAAVLVALQSSALAGAWVQKQDAYYFKLTGGYLYTTEEYDSDGNVRPIRGNEPGISNTSYEEVSATGYLEYGATSRLTLVANLPFKIITSTRTELPSPGSPLRNLEIVTGGLSDLTLSGRFLLFGTSTPVSVQAGAKLPLGYDTAPPDEGPPLGSGKVDVEGSVLAGAGLWPIRFYATGQFGYRVRGGDGIADEYLFQLEGGFTPGNLLVKATLDGIYSAERATDESSASVTVTNQDVLKIIPTVAYRFHRRFALGAEVIHTLSGRNTLSGTTWTLGVVLRN